MVNKTIKKKCNLCYIDWFDETFDNYELNLENENIRKTGRCINCYEEYGDEYPDR